MMTRMLVPVVLFLLPVLNAYGQEKPADSRIVSVGMFKNGLAVITREVEIPAPGTYLVKDLPEPIHGTFWVESDFVEEIRLTHKIVKKKGNFTPSFSSINKLLVGKTVTLLLNDKEVINGKIVKRFEHLSIMAFH